MTIPKSVRNLALKHQVSVGKDSEGNYTVRDHATGHIVEMTRSVKPTAKQAVAMIRRYLKYGPAFRAGNPRKRKRKLMKLSKKMREVKAKSALRYVPNPANAWVIASTLHNAAPLTFDGNNRFTDTRKPNLYRTRLAAEDKLATLRKHFKNDVLTRAFVRVAESDETGAVFGARPRQRNPRIKAGPGDGYKRVYLSKREVVEWKRHYPASGLKDKNYWFEFDTRGNLVNTNVGEEDDGPGASALAQDAQDAQEKLTRPKT